MSSEDQPAQFGHALTRGIWSCFFSRPGPLPKTPKLDHDGRQGDYHVVSRDQCCLVLTIAQLSLMAQAPPSAQMIYASQQPITIS